VSNDDDYDDLVLGSGEAGKYIAWTLAKAGRRVAVIERELIGGSCPNVACLPSKNVIYSARVAALCRRGREFGVETGPVGIDMRAVRQRKRDMVDDLVAVHRRNYANSGAELIMGEGRFVAPKTIEVRTDAGASRNLTGSRIFLDVGTRSTIPDLPGLSDATALTHVEALELDHVPEHLIVLGGGYIGLEFAQPMRRFGARVTILERGPHVASREDPDVATVLEQQYAEEGIEIMLSAKALEVTGRSGRKVSVRVSTAAGERLIEGSESPQFTHVAFDDYRVVRNNLSGGHRTTSNRLIPYCVFTDPELGRVGLNESQARRAGVAYRLSKIPMSAVLRTRTLAEPRGFLKALVAADGDHLLGFTALGAEAGELIAAVQIAMLTRASYKRLRDAILTHPTMAEGLTVLFANEPVRPSEPPPRETRP
jgi:pyruvate/2-oxoglutarate dehydrogenase complex dihydrolipoamide dehydrogenase (E3) component